ncbi:MAG: Excinuclease cho, partial [Pseudomonadota bacterium]
MAHMRAEDEREMMSQTSQVEYIETAGEIGALLLESNLIKTLNPIFNVRLRRLRKLCTIQIEAKGNGLTPHIVSGQDLGLGRVDGLYGLFSSVHSAQSKLRELSDQHRLCLGLLGLEKISQRGCFG